MTLSHIDTENSPTMVNVGGKKVTHRIARAQAIIDLPKEILDTIEGNELQSLKGPVFQTAIIAGTMAAKKTAEWIPFCHPIGLDHCKIDISINEKQKIIVRCSCEVEHKTGVEMEALTGATVAALTIYDMCKGLSHDIIIERIELLEKGGGKSDYQKP
ncbi:MAG: cyclic pyranopterin monophosphate synthase MoaC [Kiritimatiellae bacterium]|nr:cyclic pyranopterin monophosphate synthase MoaC [Kiritimatiellia bacterium]